MSEWTTQGPELVEGLLGEGLLAGQREVVTSLRPERLARPVEVGRPDLLIEEIERLCQVWGGAGQPLLPVSGSSVGELYTRLLETEQVDGVGGLQGVAPDLPARVEMRHPDDYPALPIAAAHPREDYRTLEVCELQIDDPWRAVYAVVLGLIPPVPSPELIKAHFLRQDLAFEDVIPVDRVAVTGSAADLIERVARRDVFTPRRFAGIELASGLRPDTSYMGHDQEVIPQPGSLRRAAGPNILVAVEADSVDDLALLWNLRVAHGDSRSLPIGVLVDELTEDVYRALQEPGRASMFGLGGGKVHVVSTSLSVAQLKGLLPGVPEVCVVDPQSLLTFGPAPGRPRSHVSIWNGGKTRLEPMSEADRQILREAHRGTRTLSLTLDVSVQDAPLPADPTMRGTRFFGRFQGGSAQVPVQQNRGAETVEVRWPSSWTCFVAVSQSRGLDVRPSIPGRSASTLVRSIGSVDGVYWLAHTGLISLLYRMAERSGMSWWKQRWATTHKQLLEQGADPQTLENAAELLGRDDPAVAPAGEGRAVPFQEFVKVLGEKAARHWVSWAERRHLLVRGADVRCPGCGTEAWLPLAAVPPPVPCPGCGREIDRPYGPRALTFSYRLGEPLRRVLEHDSLAHLFAMRWLLELIGRGDGVVGAHPGVEFVDPDTGQVVGEADVLLLFADGSMVPVEVKRRASGATVAEIAKMDTVAELLQAPWDVLAVCEPARDSSSIRHVERRLPERPRLLLTTDQLLESHAYWELGADPFSWSPRTLESDAARDRAYTERLRERDPDEPWDLVSESLLDRDLLADSRPSSAAPKPTNGA